MGERLEGHDGRGWGGADVSDAIKALRERIGDRKIIASVSGGKDSAAARLYMRELGIPDEQVRNVAMDTGWEWSGWREYVDGPLSTVIGPVEIISAPRQFADLVRHKQMFPSRIMRFCTQELKVYPMQRFIRALVAGEAKCETCDGDGTVEGSLNRYRDECPTCHFSGQQPPVDVLNVVGIRRLESRARSLMTEWEWSDGFDCEVWRPIFDWTEGDVIAIHHRHGLTPNPLYLKGAKRVGCWPCIYASKDEIKLVAKIDPDRIDEIRDLEAEINAASDARAIEKDRDIEAGRHLFQLRVPSGMNYRASIDEVVKWSRTLRGGKVEDKRLSLFDSMGINDGCMRWGLCETAAPDEDVSTPPATEGGRDGG